MARWDKLEAETSLAYSAFHAYMLCSKPRSIDAAYFRANPDQNQIGKRAAWQWFKWSTDHDWVERATAYDVNLLKQDELLWEERRRRKKEREWDQAEAISAIVGAAIPHAEQFIRRKTAFIKGENGQPDREIITVQFDLAGLTSVAERLQRIQNLVLGDATENVNLLSGAALDALLAREFARAVNGGQTSGSAADDGDEAGFDDFAADGDGEVQE